MPRVKNLVVGCGLSGAIIAERIASELGEEVLVIDKREHIGGNCYDYKDQNGITIHQYGPHVFHTNIKEVWDYLSQFTKWHLFFYQVKAYIDGIESSIPFNLNSIYQVFPKKLAETLEQKLVSKYGYGKKVFILDMLKENEADIQFLAQYVYDKVFKGYTTKQWGDLPENLSPSVSARVPILISRDDRYFQDTYQAIPQLGYTNMVKNILSHKNISVRLNTDFNQIKKDIHFERLFYTGSIDEYFQYEFGQLPYRSLNIVFNEYKQDYLQSCPQLNYPNDYDFTRSVEYKYYLDEKSGSTVVSFEYPEDFKNGMNERFYPIENDNTNSLYSQYFDLTKTLNSTYFLGRLGDYKYYNMDLTVNRALNLFTEVKNG